MFNILTENLIRYKCDNGKIVWASLPQVYAALVADDIAAFPALRPHQHQPAGHSFLVQLGVMAIHNASLSELPTNADEWSQIIRALTPDFPEDEPWQQVVADITKPAFMQPPVSSKELEKDYKNRLHTPDELDMLVTSKNHDLKASVASSHEIDDWLFALITTQTMEGYSGARNYGISRMPSGYGNRPAFSVTPSVRPGVHIKRDIMALLERRQEIVGDYEYPSDGGTKLLWTIVWDGKKSESLLINRMDPFYIEICRRIRMRRNAGRIFAIRANSASRRIADIKGLTGDPWAPVGNNPNQRGTPPAFLGPRKFGYERVVDGLFSADWKQPYLLDSTQFDENHEGTIQLVARGMIRGEGGTSGYHERVIPMRRMMAQSMSMMRGRPQAKQLEDIARERIEQIGKVKNILRHAIATFAAKGNSDFAAHRNGQPSPNQLARPWTDKLDEIVDANFFNDVQDEFEADESERDGIRKKWLLNGNDGVVDQAERFLKAAEDAIPSLSIQKFKARVRADSTFWGRIRGNEGLPFLFEIEEGE